MQYRGWLTLAACHIPTQPFSHSPSSTEQGNKVIGRSSATNMGVWGEGVEIIYFKCEKQRQKTPNYPKCLNYFPQPLPIFFLTYLFLHPLALCLNQSKRDGEWGVVVNQYGEFLIYFPFPPHTISAWEHESFQQLQGKGLRWSGPLKII